MRQYRRFAAVSALALAIAACGGPAEEDNGATSEAEDVVTEQVASLAAEGDAETGSAEADEAGEAVEVAVPEASATPSPTASPTATPTSKPTPAASAAPVVAMAPPAAFTQCAICHSVEPGKNSIGPSLAGVVGRRSASVSSFTYSAGMRSANLTWNEATLDRYLGDPVGVVPGTAMALPGVEAAQRRAIIAYLKSL